MAAIAHPAPTRTTRWSSGGARLALAGLAALLLAVGAARRRPDNEVQVRTETVPRLGAKELLLTLYHRITEDRVMAIAAGVTFYALLAIFPAIAALVSIYGLVADVKTINADITSLGSFLPSGAISVVGDQIKRVASNSNGTLGFAAVLGIGISIWSANSGVKSMFDALNIVLKEDEKRSFVRLNLTSLAFTVGGLVLVLLAVAFVVLAPAILKYVGLSGRVDWLIRIGRWPVLWAGLAFVIALLYRFGPSRNDIPWRWITWGSALAALVWLLASMAFSWYAAKFGTYNKTYGSLGAVIGFMTWIWISAMIVLVGEELNEILDKRQHPLKRDSKPHPLGARRNAAMAR